MKTYLERAIAFVAGFFRNKKDESMTRLVTLVLAFGALVLCWAIYRVATRASLNDAAAVIVAIAGALTPVIAGGVVALSKRTKATDTPANGDPKP
jgi:ABC-type dipeptide/oligopeptide/nickel transport system permease subunit